MVRGSEGFLAAAIFCGLTSGALAGPDVYCDAYARDVADRKTGHGADILVGTIGGAIGGALIGGLIDKGDGAGKGAVIGGVGGTVVGAAAVDEKWQRSYEKIFAECMDNYQPQKVEAAAVPEEAAPVKKSGKPKPGTKAWVAYCAAHYRSFDPDTGKYKSYSGVMKPCR
jgi:hypothetical protein